MANIDALTQAALAEVLAAHGCSIISVGHV